MTVTVDAVAVELARPTPTSPTSDQWQAWIDRAYRLIEARLGATAYAALDPQVLDDVVVQAVAQYARAWRDTTASSYTVSVDDGSTTRRYEAGVGTFIIPDDLWRLLDPAITDSGAFTVTPYSEPDTSALNSWA